MSDSDISWESESDETEESDFSEEVESSDETAGNPQQKSRASSSARKARANPRKNTPTPLPSSSSSSSSSSASSSVVSSSFLHSSDGKPLKEKSAKFVQTCLAKIDEFSSVVATVERQKRQKSPKNGGTKRKRSGAKGGATSGDEDRIGPLGEAGVRPVESLAKLESRLTLAAVLKDDDNAWLRRPLSERTVSLFFSVPGVDPPPAAVQPCGDAGARIAAAYLRPAIRNALDVLGEHKLYLPQVLVDAAAPDDGDTPLSPCLRALAVPVHLEYFGYPMRKDAALRDVMSNDMYVEHLSKTVQGVACWTVLAAWLATQSALGRWLHSIRVEVRAQLAEEEASARRPSLAAGDPVNLRSIRTVPALIAEARRSALAVRLVCAVTTAVSDRLDDPLYLLSLFGLPGGNRDPSLMAPPPLATDDYLLFVEVYGETLPEGVMSLNLAAGGEPVRRSAAWAGAIALDLECGRLQDVSGVYSSNARFLQVASTVKLAATLFAHDAHPGAAGCEERARTRANAIDMPLPTRVGDFKYHPLYCLERFVSGQEAIHPREPVAYFGKGDRSVPVYPRSSLCRLLTDDKWLIEGMQIKPGEEPIKYLGKRPVRPARGRRDASNSAAALSAVASGAVRGTAVAARDTAAGDEGDEHDNADEAADPFLMPLYGPWQVEPYKPPEISEDGVVPRNRYGNVYLFQPSFLPRHCVHITGVTEAAAKKLGVDAVPAMVGWHLVRMRYLPKIEGVVVPEWEETRILASLEQGNDRAAQARKAKARGLWAELTAKLRLAAEVQRAYAS